MVEFKAKEKAWQQLSEAVSERLFGGDETKGSHGENRASSSAQLEGVGSGGGVTAVRRSAVMSARLRAMSGGVMVVIMVGVLGGLWRVWVILGERILFC